MGKLLAMDLLSGLSGLLSSVISELTSFLTDILMAILKLALVLIVGVLKSVFCVIGYTISAFILSLIDFLEVIFRLLAGLEVDGATLTIGGPTWGNQGETPDLLIQLIRNDAIQQAFLAMCIVGIFLLVMTTIFQMIKVEYTTEGAKNAKGPILEKAFKGLANLMLIPILCIFGVFLGNEILGLIDTATRGTGDSPSIGGALFVAAAGDARYQDGELRCIIDPVALGVGVGVGPAIVLTYVVGYSVVQTFIDYYNISEGKEDKVFDPPAGNPYVSESDGPLSYDQIDNNFINGVWGFKYTNMGNVTSYYNFLDINYILLIVGGCICIKCLYNVCFGMILRLYYCTALFILSPVVIGMSPVTDNMGKWRTAFIGKAISAYGVVLSMNLFFTIIKVLLSIDISFDSALDYSFGLEFATGLIKGIMVMGGCLMIEKWSKEFGAYFGAEDALSSGAQFAKETGELTKKAVTTAVLATAAVAAGVVTGGAGSGAVAGIAGKIGMLGAKAGAGLSKAGTALAGKGGVGKVAGKALEGMGGALSKGGEAINSSSFVQKHLVNETAEVVGNKKRKSIGQLSDTIERSKKKQSLLESRNSVLYDELEVAEKIRDPQKRASKIAEIEQKIDANERGIAIEKGKISTTQSYLDKETAEYSRWQETDEGKEDARSSQARANNAAERMVARGAFGKAIGGLAKRNGLIGAVMGGFADGKKEWEGYEKEGAVGPEGEAALGVVTGERKDRAEDRYKKRNADDIDTRNTVQAQILNDAIREAMRVQADETRRAAEKQVAAIEKMREALEHVKDGVINDKNSAFHGQSATSVAERMAALEEKLKEAGASKGADGQWKKSVDGKIDIDIKGADAIEAVMKKAIAQGMDTKKITDELTKVFEEQGAAGNKKLLEEILKAIEKVKSSTGGGK